MSLKGRWRIVEMELWDEDAIDLVGPAFIELRDDDQLADRQLPNGVDGPVARLRGR